VAHRSLENLPEIREWGTVARRRDRLDEVAAHTRRGKQSSRKIVRRRKRSPLSNPTNTRTSFVTIRGARGTRSDHEWVGATGLPLENLGGGAKVDRHEAVWSLGHRESPFEGYVSVNALIVDRFFESRAWARRDRTRAASPRGDDAETGRDKASVRSLTHSRGLKANLDGSLKP
jgi:hypothetical protein